MSLLEEKIDGRAVEIPVWEEQAAPQPGQETPPADDIVFVEEETQAPDRPLPESEEPISPQEIDDFIARARAAAQRAVRPPPVARS